MSQRLKMTPYQHFTVLRHDPGVLELDAVWGPSPKKAPKQLHPSQEEQFDVVAGELTVRLDGDVHVFGAGSSFTIPAGAVHGVWNGGTVEARAVWRTLPALRTLELFEDIDGLYRSGVVASDEMPSLTMWATLLTEYRDVLRLAAKPASAVRGVFALLASFGRRRGYLPRRELRAEAESAMA
jgi:mannose-6-phosphate isomerase-like protein (cupin superfamily)